MKRFEEFKSEKPECVNIYVNADGKLCELEKRGHIIVNKLFNCIRWDYDGSIKLSFNPEFISAVGW